MSEALFGRLRWFCAISLRVRFRKPWIQKKSWGLRMAGAWCGTQKPYLEVKDVVEEAVLFVKGQPHLWGFGPSSSDG